MQREDNCYHLCLLLIMYHSKAGNTGEEKKKTKQDIDNIVLYWSENKRHTDEETGNHIFSALFKTKTKLI